MTTDLNAPAPATPQETHSPALQQRGISRWTAFGTGVGVEIRDKEILVTVVRVRPSATGVLGAATVTDFRTRPAAEWGTELLAFLRKLGAAHIACTVLLPRRDVIVRTLHLPGVSDNDLESAVRLQIESLHPFSEEEVSFSQSRIGQTPYVLVGIARRSVIDNYVGLLGEAGLKVASFTFSAAAIYSALRVITTPSREFVLLHQAPGGMELYGESEARPIYTATLPMSSDRAIGVARAELRLDPATEAFRLIEYLPRPTLYPADLDPKTPAFEAQALPYATGLASACPWLSLDANLLPPELRKGSSRIRLIPTITLATALTVLLIMLALQQSWADSRYLAVLQHEIARYEPGARRVDSLNKSMTAVRARAQVLDDFRRRSKLDMDTLAEVTKLIPPPGWVTNLDMDRNTIQLAGEADQAQSLLKTFDSSPLFERSEFTMPITRQGNADLFRIRAAREIPPLVPPPARPGQGPALPTAASTPATPAGPSGSTGSTGPTGSTGTPAPAAPQGAKK